MNKRFSVFFNFCNDVTNFDVVAFGYRKIDNNAVVFGFNHSVTFNRFNLHNLFTDLNGIISFDRYLSDLSLFSVFN